MLGLSVVGRTTSDSKPSVLALFPLFFLFLVSGNAVDLSEMGQLLELKKAFYDTHNMLASWKSTSPNHCSWFGVTCNSHARVSELKIPGGNFAHSASCSNNKYSDLALHGFGIERNCSASKKGKFLGGKLSNVIGKFTELRSLSLPFNQLSGELPNGIWGLKNLEVIDIEGNLITGNLSVIDFSSLKNLQVLNLGFNRLFGEIPSSLSESKELSILSLSGNKMRGSVPVSFRNLAKLKGVYLAFNRLVESLPDEFFNNCRVLEHVDFSGNFLNGSIPKSLGNCSKLRTLLLFSNAFGGVLPSELGSLNMLEVLDVSRNRLDGPIPTSLRNCVNLAVLVLSSHFNDHNGKGLVRDSNSFEGSIPLDITMLPNLKLLWAPSCNLVGELPMNWGNCNTLEMVNVAGNLLHGGVSGVFGKCLNLHFLNLSSNRITGNLDHEIRVPCMKLFDVSRNLMVGSIPEFKYNPCSHLNSYRQFDPSFVYLSYFSHKSQLDSPLPLSPSFPAVIHDFSNNNFTGSIPLFPLVSPDLTGKKIDYAFLAGGNKLSGRLFNQNVFKSCNSLNGFFLNVSHNILSGKIPPNIGVLWKCLKFLDASDNQILGPVPKSLLNLRKIIVLLLNNNKLSGEVPSGFGKMKSLANFNFSFNNLSGSLMLDHDAMKMNCSSFIGNPFLHSCRIVSLSSVPPQEPRAVGIESLNSSVSRDSSGGSKKGFSSFELVLIIAASVIVLILLVLIIVYLYMRKRKPSSRVEGISTPRPARGRREQLVVFKEVGAPLNLDTVIQATGNFTSRNCIGSGGFGSTYRAEISPGTIVAVKRLTIEMCQGVPQFNAEIQSLRRVRHPNLITLIGYYASTSEMFLIYNYLSGGNLEKFIQERSSRVSDLKVLHKIALNVAEALAYLHDQCNPRILHRDVKPSNILLDEECNAYLSDFGLSRLMEGFETHVTTGVAGTFGYVAPEYALTCRASDKVDVYSYGVMLLEMISDKRALDASFSSQENGYTIVSWAEMLRREGRPQEVFAAGLWDMGPEDVLLELLHLGLICTSEAVPARPTMRQVVRKLKQIQASFDC